MSLQVSPSTATPFMPIANATEKNAEDPRNTITRHDTFSLSQAAREAGCATISFVDADITPGAGKELISLHESDTLQATSATGTLVSVTRNRTGDVTSALDKPTPANENQAAEAAASYTMRLTQADGTSFDLDFSDNIRIREGGQAGTSVYFMESDITRTYGMDGSISETVGNTIEEDASSIIVNTRADALYTGNGDNLVFNWADNADITTGNGNDTIVLRDNATGNMIHTGDGNDIVMGKQIVGSSINLGEGNNSVIAAGMENSSISAGNGNNKIHIQPERDTAYYEGAGDFVNSSIIVADGNNSLNLGSIQENSSITVGSGNNVLIAGNLNGQSGITFGDGDNALNIYSLGEKEIPTLLAETSQANRDQISDHSSLEGSASIEMGHGNNTLSINQVASHAEIKIGDGQNKATIYEIDGNGSVSLGNGKNLVSACVLNDNGILNIGNGNNTVNISEVNDSGSVILGNGNNSVRTYRTDNHASLKIGNGNNALRIFEINSFSSVSLGNGNNNVSVDIMNGHGSLDMGDGDNIFSVNVMGNSSHIKTGKGQNLGLIGSMSYSSSISGTNYYFMPFLTKLEHNNVSRQYKQAMEERRQQGLPAAGSSLQDMKEISENKYMSLIKDQRYQLYPQGKQSSYLEHNIDFSWQTSDLWADMMNTFDYGWSDLHLDHYV